MKCILHQSVQEQLSHVLRQLSLMVALLQRVTTCFPFFPTHAQSLITPFLILNCMVESTHNEHVPHVIGQWALTENFSQRAVILEAFFPTHLQLFLFAKGLPSLGK